jgi:hypothetical protein
VDQYWADEISGEEVFYRYIARNTPVLIRGLLHEWKALEAYTLERLNATHGDMQVTVGSIPYVDKFGGEGGELVRLTDYIQDVRLHRMKGGTHPWYVFRGHPVGSSADGSGSFVPIGICPTPPTVQEAFAIAAREKLAEPDLRSRKLFVNAQWAFGGEGTGAPVSDVPTVCCRPLTSLFCSCTTTTPPGESSVFTVSSALMPAGPRWCTVPRSGSSTRRTTRL